MSRRPISAQERAFLDHQRVGHLASADPLGNPHLVPVCFCLTDATLYITIDGKPKRAGATPLKRLSNIAANPRAAFLVDRYDEDWSRLGWVMLRGAADILDGGDEHAWAQAALKLRYPQYRSMNLAGLPVIALRVSSVTAWGDLSIPPP